MLAKPLLNLLAIAKRPLLPAYNLHLFMALARHQHDVADAGLGDGMTDRLGAIVNHAYSNAIREAVKNIINNDRGRLVARIIIRYDGLVSMPLGDLGHQGPLARITIAAASEHAP